MNPYWLITQTPASDQRVKKYIGIQLILQGDQLNMALFFWYLVKKCFVHCTLLYTCRVHWISHFFQGTRKTRSCVTGDSVGPEMKKILVYDRISEELRTFCANHSIDEVREAAKIIIFLCAIKGRTIMEKSIFFLISTAKVSVSVSDLFFPNFHKNFNSSITSAINSSITSSISSSV